MLKHVVVFFIVKFVSGCLYQTFHNTSVTVVGVRRPFETIDGCFSPEKNLDKISLVQILNQSVPILYEEAFNDLEFLIDIVLENNGIKEIRRGAFKNLPKLYLIKLKNNELREIRVGIFNNLSISELSLVNNKLERIESNAFDNLPNLNIILLGNNRLSKWDPLWFKGSPQINVLNFEHNYITSLPNKAFQNIKGTHVVNNLNVSTSIHLNNNNIQFLEDGALDGLETLGWLFLQHNDIRNFNENSLGSLKQLDWLKLDHNKLECIPEKLFVVAPTVRYYLEGNSLTEECIDRFNLTTRNNGVKKIDIKINK